METRKITIINNKTQSQRVIENSTATTLGELKAEMRREGIDYTGMSFFEGHLRAELKDDASILPTNIPYRGQIVNDLVFAVTASRKKIKSGGMSREREVAYAEIREKGLQAECISKFGKNFTRCSTQELIELLNEHTSKDTTVKEEGVTCDVSKDSVVSLEIVAAILGDLVKELHSSNVISNLLYKSALNKLNISSCNSTSELIPQEEVDSMFDFLKEDE